MASNCDQRFPETRMDELLALHDQLDNITKGSISRNATWTVMYRSLVQLPQPLEASLVVVNLLGYLERDGGRALVEDLIIHGEESDTYGSILRLWVSLGEDKERPVEWIGDTQQCFRTLAAPFSDPLESLVNPSSPSKVMEHFSSLRGQVAVGWLFFEAKWIIAYMKNTAKISEEITTAMNTLMQSEHHNFYSVPVYGVVDSSLAPLFHAMGTITEEKVKRFISLAEEYNLEWALAAFEWSEEGRANTPLGRIQAIVDEAPWSIHL